MSTIQTDLSTTTCEDEDSSMSWSEIPKTARFPALFTIIWAAWLPIIQLVYLVIEMPMPSMILVLPISLGLSFLGGVCIRMAQQGNRIEELTKRLATLEAKQKTQTEL